MRLADRSLTQTNPLLAVVGQLLDLAGGRAEASRVLDLLAAEPVRRRFGFTDNDLETITGWVEQAGIRWAFDADHRAPFGLRGYVQNTWRFGLDRVLAGVAVSDDAERFFGTTLPLDDVGSTSIDLAGRLAERLDRLQHVTDRLTGSHPVGHWLDALREGVDALTAVARGDEWQTGQVHRELAALGAEHGRTRARAAAARRTRADVRAARRPADPGQLPHRHAHRLHDGADAVGAAPRGLPARPRRRRLPARGRVDGDDVLARTPLTGERDPRSEDRQLMLDAIIAAGEHLVVTYTGANETTGPAAAARRTARRAARRPRRHRAGRPRRTRSRHHPLQAFDPPQPRPGTSAAPPFSFDAAALAGARGRRRATGTGAR